MTPDESIALTRNLRKNAEIVANHEDLADFVADLLDAYENGHFERQNVIDYLGGMQALLAALDSWSRNVWEMDKAPEQPDWRWMARLLHAAFYHS